MYLIKDDCTVIAMELLVLHARIDRIALFGNFSRGENVTLVLAKNDISEIRETWGNCL